MRERPGPLGRRRSGILCSLDMSIPHAENNAAALRKALDETGYIEGRGLQKRRGQFALISIFLTFL